MEKYSFVYGILFWGTVCSLLYGIRPKALIHKNIMTALGWREKMLLGGVLILTVLACTLPMSISPYYNGEIPDHRNQYELMAESILEKHLYIDYDDVDPKLAEMENPYDPVAREKAGVMYHWDHAWYEGHYYMYFGVVPVFLLFLPYRIITGMALVTYKATQVFVAATIAGIFALFYELAMTFAKRLFFSMYLFMATAFSIMSVWYSIGTPALYSTAIVSAVCLEVWSLFFFVRAVWIEEMEHKQIRLAFIGALFGALTFGCRPPVALANLLVIPMLVYYLRRKQVTWNLVCKLVAAASPYFMVALMLMLYNYLRFADPFEFGQAYQLTLADQHLYGSISTTFVWHRQISLLLFNFIDYVNLTEDFPYIFYGGVFVNFPVLLLIFMGGGRS